MRNLTVFEKTPTYNDTEKWVSHYLKTQLSKDSLSKSQSASIAITHIDTKFLTEASYTNGQGRPDV